MAEAKKKQKLTKPKILVEECKDGKPIDYSHREIEDLSVLIETKKTKKNDSLHKEGENKGLKDDESGNKGGLGNEDLIASPRDIPGEKKEEKDDAKKNEVQHKPLEIVPLIPQTNQFDQLKKNSTVIQDNATGALGSKIRNETEKNNKRKAVIKLITTTINFGYNKLYSISNLAMVVKELGIYIPNIEWLDLQHNNISVLPACMLEFKNLNALYLHCNKIYDLNELDKIKTLPIRHLTIHGNPVDRIPNFRLFIINIFDKSNEKGIQKIDTVLCTKKEKDNAKVWKMIHYKTLPKYEGVEAQPKENQNSGQNKEDNSYLDQIPI